MIELGRVSARDVAESPKENKPSVLLYGEWVGEKVFCVRSDASRSAGASR